MKSLQRLFKIFYVCIAAVLFLVSGSVYANVLKMYEFPKLDAKVVGTINISEGVMPIFTPKNSEWVKIADPKNGNVGWVKSSELNSGPVTTISFTQKLGEGNNKGQNYQVFEFGNSSAVMTDETREQLKKMQAQQLINEKTVQESLQKVVNDINSIYKQQINMLRDNDFPIVMPIVIFPVQNLTKQVGSEQTKPSTLPSTKPVDSKK